MFKKLGALIQKLIDFLGFLFSWNETMDTTDSLATMLNAALNYGEKKVTKTETDVKKWLGDLKKLTKDQLSKLSQHDFKSTDSNERDQRKAPRIQAAEQERQDSVEGGVGCNWASYQLQYGGAATNATLRDSSTKSKVYKIPQHASSPCGRTNMAIMIDSSTDKINAMWHDLQNELKTIQGFVLGIFDDFKDFFTEGNLDVNTLISKILGHTVDLVMDSLVNISDIIFKAVELGFDMIRGLCGYEIDMPVFTWLWKLVAQGRPFNLGNFISLLVAIPSTLVYKVVRGKAPPKLKGRLTGSTFQEYIETESVSQDKDLAGDILSFNICAASGIGSIIAAVTTIGLAVDGVFAGAGYSSQELQVAKMYGSGSADQIHTYLSLPDWVGNTFDVGSIILEGLQLFASWPSQTRLSKQSTGTQACFWGVSFLPSQPLFHVRNNHTDY